MQPPRKTDTESYYTGAERLSGLHDLLSLHDRPNGKRIQVPVGDISQVGRGEGRLGRPSPCLQNLMDLLNNKEVVTLLTSWALTQRVRQSRDGQVSKRNDRLQPERNGVARHPHFLTPVETNKPSISGRYCSIRERYFRRALMGQNKSSSQSPSTKSSKKGTVNSSK